MSRTEFCSESDSSVPIDQAEREGGTEIIATIPNSVSWRRVIREWGDPGFFIGAVPQNGFETVYCLQGLGAKVEATIGDRPLALEPAFPPYLYTADCSSGQFGLMFRAPPGAVVKIHVTAINPNNNLANLIVEPSWSNTKDRIVGLDLHEDLLHFVSKLAVGGLIAIAIAVLLYLRRPRRVV
jgi:hypothetical protein